MTQCQLKSVVIVYYVLGRDTEIWYSLSSPRRINWVLENYYGTCWGGVGERGFGLTCR